MLKSLKNQSPEDVERLLASSIHRLLPQSGIEPLESEDAESDVPDKLLSEIRENLRLDSGDQSTEARAKIFEFLLKEISDPVMKGARQNEAKARLGQRGDLRPDLYQIEFNEQFREAEKLGVRRSHVERALRHPDQVQHLPIERSQPEEYHTSLYAQNHTTSRSAERFTLLVQTQRKGYTQIVGPVWRIYHSDVDLSSSYQPLNILRAFVDVYGMYCRVGNSPRSKFFLYDTFPLAESQQATNILTIDNPNNESFYSSTMFRVSDLRVVEVAIVYVINTSRYIRDLHRHNVHF